MRIQIRGGRLRVIDAPTFNEEDHPRASNGQFTSGGGVTGKANHGGVTAPKKGTASHTVWSLAAELQEQKKVPTAKAVAELAASKGHTLNTATIGTQLAHYKKYQAGAKAENAPKPVAPVAPAQKVPLSVEAFKAKVESHSGMKSEGTYSGKVYYKNSEGAKASYEPSSETWMVKSPSGSITTGEGEAEFGEALKKEVPAVSTAPPEPAPPANVPPPKTSVLSSSRYGVAMATHASGFDYSSKGAATDTGFVPGIRKAIKAYRGSDYKEINKAMRFDVDYSSVNAETMRNVLCLKRAFEVVPPTTQDIQVGRKVGMDALKTMAAHAGLTALEELQPGVELRDTGIISTSYHTHVWSGSVKFEVTVPKGSKAIDLSETINSAEAELMLPPDSGFKIKQVLKDHLGHEYYIICEHIP